MYGLQFICSCTKLYKTQAKLFEHCAEVDHRPGQEKRLGK